MALFGSWIADVTVMEAFEGGVLDLPDFYFTGDDYRYRFEPEVKRQLLDLLRERFNSAARYKGRALTSRAFLRHHLEQDERREKGSPNEIGGGAL